MNQETNTRDWWNALTPEQRRAEAVHLLGAPDPSDPWTAQWDLLSPIYQQMRLRMYFAGRLADEKGALLFPLHPLSRASA